MALIDEPADIGHLGERIVEMDLARRGYDTYRNTWQPGKVDISAVNTTKGSRILIQVKSSAIGNPAALSSDELSAIKARAQRLGFMPVAAYVELRLANSPIRYELLVPNGLLSMGWQP